MLNMALALVWILVALQLGKLYRGMVIDGSMNRAPEFTHPPEPYAVPAGTAFRVDLPADCFTDPDEGDVLTVSARCADGSPLPRWLRFDPEILRFSGQAPASLAGVTELALRATDFDGARAEGRVVLNHDG